MIELRSSLLSLAGEYTDKFEPYNTIVLEPAPGGGVMVTSTFRGNAAFLGRDAKGIWDEDLKQLLLLPTSELLTPCKGIKTAERRIEIDLQAGVATVYTLRKTTTQKQLVPFLVAPSGTKSVNAALMAGTIKDVFKTDAEQPVRLGRYDAKLVSKAMRMFAEAEEFCVLSAGDTPLGPLRIYCQAIDSMVVIAAADKTGEAFEPVPEWIKLAAAEPPTD